MKAKSKKTTYATSSDNNTAEKDFSVKLCSPVFICSLIFFVIAYIVDFAYFKGNPSNIGEASAVSSLFTGLGSILKTTAFVLISVGIAFKKGGIFALPASLIGGIFAASGSTVNSISGNLAGITGVFGCILAGYTAAASVKLTSKYIFRSTEKELHRILCYITSSVICTLVILLTNELSQIINTYSTELLGVLADYKNILFPIVIGIFITIDGSGPLHLCAYLFGVSSVIAGKPQVMAAVMAAGMVTPLSISLFAFIFDNRLEKDEKITAYFGIIPALLGLPQAALPFYVSKKFRVILPCLAGSIITSVLTVLLGCSTTSPVGGFLTIDFDGKPLYILLCVLFGVVCSTALMSVAIRSNLNDTEKNTETSEISISAS